MEQIMGNQQFRFKVSNLLNNLIYYYSLVTFGKGKFLV